MRVSALLRNAYGLQEVALRSGPNARSHTLQIPARATGGGSSVSGGELLMLALASCYCNDLYREAAMRGLPVHAVEVEASAEFAGVGLAARHIRYRARIDSPASAEQIAALLAATDAVAEVHNTIRTGVDVRRMEWPVAETSPP